MLRRILRQRQILSEEEIHQAREARRVDSWNRIGLMRMLPGFRYEGMLLTTIYQVDPDYISELYNQLFMMPKNHKDEDDLELMRCLLNLDLYIANLKGDYLKQLKKVTCDLDYKKRDMYTLMKEDKKYFNKMMDNFPHQEGFPLTDEIINLRKLRDRCIEL